MPRTKKNTEPKPVKEKISKMEEKDVLLSNYMPYTMSVIVDRAIPAIDGFKPSHRKLLQTMYRMGLLNGKRTKSANIAGEGMKLNPHGDTSIYETMVRLTQNNGTLMMPFVDGKGNFGHKYNDDAFAAARYTEAKLMPICNEIFSEFSKDAVDFIDNYDGTLKEAMILPTPFPNILVSANMGIAVGMASNFPGFNFSEVCLATAEYIKHPKTDIRSIMPAPDFTTGGRIVVIPEEMDEIYRSGRGSFAIESVWKHDEKNNIVLVSEIPYTTTSNAIIDKITELMKAGKIPEVADVRDESDLNGLSIAIDFKRGTKGEVERVMDYLMDNTTLRDNFGCNFNLLIDGTPKVLGIKDIMDEWVKFRTVSKERVLKFDKNTLSKRLHLLEGLNKVLLNIDKAIKIIKNSNTDKEAIEGLMKGFKVDEVQAEYIADIKLRNINKEYILKQTKDIEKLKTDIAAIDKILSDPNGIKKVIVKELLALEKKYHQNRISKIVAPKAKKSASKASSDGAQAKAKAVSRFVSISKEGYIKRDSEGIKVTDEDELIVVSSEPFVYKAKIKKVTDKEQYVGSVAEIGSGEKVMASFILDPKKYMCCAYENGKMSLYEMKDFVTVQERKKLKNAYSKISKLINAEQVSANDVVFIKTSKDRKFAVPMKKLSIQGKGSNGIQVVRLHKGELIKAMRLATPEEIEKLKAKKK